MSDPSHAPPAPLPRARERTIAALCTHFAADHLELPELERRLAAVSNQEV
mgnify:CR=1 FL=1